MHRVIAGLALCAAALLVGPAEALADSGGSATTDNGGIDHQVNTDTGEPGHGGAGTTPCSYTLLPIPGDASIFDVDGTVIKGDGTGFWYEKSCGNTFFGAVYISRRDPRALAEEARRYLPLPLPDPVMSPGGDQIVNLASWLWIGGPWAVRTSTVSVPGVSVTVTARPETAIWSMGDGTQVVCDGPGTPYDPAQPESSQQPTCAHTYRRSSAREPGLSFDASVTVRWHATWTVSGFLGGGDLGTIDRTTRFAVRVGEVQAINIGAN